MTDITKCKDSKCPARLMCYRFTAPANEHRQAYGIFNREEDADNCDMFFGGGSIYRGYEWKIFVGQGSFYTIEKGEARIFTSN